MAALRVVTAAVVGGTISELTGGKFANGAVTAAFGQLLNGERQAAVGREWIAEQRAQLEALIAEIEHILGFFESPEFFGALSQAGSIIGGGAQVIGGGALCVGTGGLACVGGIGLMVLGADNLTEGLSNNEVQPLRSALTVGLGSQEAANWAHAGINITSSAAAALKQVPKSGIIGIGESRTQAVVLQSSKVEILTEVFTTGTTLYGPLSD